MQTAFVTMKAACCLSLVTDLVFEGQEIDVEMESKLRVRVICNRKRSLNTYYWWRHDCYVIATKDLVRFRIVFDA